MSDTAVQAQPSIPCDEALKVTRSDAEGVYRDLSAYRISILLQDDGWHVDYELADPTLTGGGPHYVIDFNNGHIVSKRYEQ
ncbi:MAG: hypothetical protein QF473_00030 [Planctomycetota bacterium]|nr:hypothetical protein [Planctomycetota bacterium]